VSGKPSAPRIAILGARGIGRVHARIFHALGADVCAVLGRGAESAGRAALDLTEDLAIDVVPYSDLGALLSLPLDGVSVCTPPVLHFAHIVAAFDAGLPVFCEKPLLWNDAWEQQDWAQKLASLQAHPNRRLFVNTSNAFFIDAVADQLPPAETVKNFGFHFYTQGHHRGRDIAIDLLPHALSMLLRYLGERPLTEFRIQAETHQCRCRFAYGGCIVEFDFRQGPGRDKSLGFVCDDISFKRVQEGDGVSYKVSLENAASGQRWPSQDPFAAYIAEFLDHCENGGVDRFDEAALNMRLMAQCLNT
jgi:hypothetical protein